MQRGMGPVLGGKLERGAALSSHKCHWGQNLFLCLEALHGKGVDVQMPG